MDDSFLDHPHKNPFLMFRMGLFFFAFQGHPYQIKPFQPLKFFIRTLRVQRVY